MTGVVGANCEQITGSFFHRGAGLAKIMTTKELADYLKLHEVTICKYADEGKIPGIRIGRVWRFDIEIIDKWIANEENRTPPKEKRVWPIFYPNLSVTIDSKGKFPWYYGYIIQLVF